MSSKSVIILGLLASLLLIFLCVFFNAERYYKELNLGIQSDGGASSMLPSVSVKGELPSKKEGKIPVVALVEAEDNESTIAEIKEEDRVETISEEPKEETSTFSYYQEDNKTVILGNIPLLDDGDLFKAFIATCSKSDSCENNVTFLDNDEPLLWKNFVLSVLTLFEKEEITNPKLLIDKKEITLTGEFALDEGREKLSVLLKDSNESYLISNNTTVTPKEEAKKDENLTTLQSPEINATDENLTKVSPKVNEDIFAEEQEKISKLLKNNKINFKKNSGKIQKEGRKVLDKVIAELVGKENALIEIQGHTDAGGKETINLHISQIRADGVKKYLIKKGVKAENIKAKGYGEKRLLLPKKPYSSKNRRVEIYLKRK